MPLQLTRRSRRRATQAIWALGDCAAVNDAKTHKPCPPTAQFALREAKVLAGNIRAAILGGAGSRFISIRSERCA